MNPKPTKNSSKSKSLTPKPSSNELKKEAQAPTVKNYRIPTPKKEQTLAPAKTPAPNSPHSSSESILIQDYLPPKTSTPSQEKNSPKMDLEGPDVDFKALENVLEKTSKPPIPDALLEDDDVDPEAITVFDPDPEEEDWSDPESPTQNPDDDFSEESQAFSTPADSNFQTVSEKNIAHSNKQTMIEKPKVLEKAKSHTKSAPTAGKIAAYQKRRYRYVGELGSGGMGHVFKAMDLNLKREIAVKVLGKDLEHQEGPIGRFLAEAQITSQLEHPNIIPVHELGSDRKGQIFFTMKKVQGKPLSYIISRLKEQDETVLKKYTIPERLRIFRKICDAVAFAHESKVIHRDLKPDNIMIGKFGEVLVMDWGLAKVLDQKESPQNSSEPKIQTERELGAQTLDGSISGTPLYMSPEQAEGKNSEMREPTDIYSLGSILFEMLSGVPPVQGKNLQEILKNVLAGNLINLENHQKEIPPELVAIIRKCLQKKPSQRYPSVENLSQDIDAYLDEHPVLCYQGNVFYRFKKWIRRHPTLIGISSTIISFSLILFISTSYFFYKTTQLSKENEKTALAKADQEKQLKEAKELEMKRMQAFRPFSEAVELIRRQESPEIIFGKLQEALQADSSFYPAVVEIASMHEKEKNGEKAIEYFQKAQELYQQQNEGKVDLRALFHIGFIYLYQLKEKAKAITTFEEIDRQNKADSVYTLLAQAYLKLFSGNLQAALNYTKQAHGMDESRWEVHAVVAEIHSLTSPSEKQICDIGTFITDQDIKTNLPQTQDKPGQENHWATIPLACWDHALQLSPELTQAYLNRGAIFETLAEELFQTKMLPDARTHLEKAKQDYQHAKERKHPNGYLGLARIFLKEDNFNKVESLLKEFQNDFPNREQDILLIQQALSQKQDALNQSVELFARYLETKEDRAFLETNFPDNTIITYFWASNKTKSGIHRHVLVKNTRMEVLVPKDLSFPTILELTVSLHPEKQPEPLILELKQPKYSWKKWDLREEDYYQKLEIKSIK